MSAIVVQGLRELTFELSAFPEKIQRKALAAALRAGGRLVRDVARSKAPSKSGKLRRSIRVTIVRKRGVHIARIIAGRRVKKDDPYYAWMVEGGTAPHEIRPKGRKSLFLAGIFAEQIKHPGAAAKPFLAPALDAAAQAAVEAMGAVLGAEIEQLRAGA